MDKELWKTLQISGVAKIEKCVGEYNIWELNKSPYGKFKVKVFESADGKFTGYSNLQVVDSTGSFYCAVGRGMSISKALEDTVHQFFEMVSIKEVWEEKDFQCSDSFDY